MEKTVSIVSDNASNPNHLIGGKESISRLRCDVASLEDATATTVMLTMAEKSSVPLWTYPDKISAEMDVSELLQLYYFSEQDDKKSQLAHVVLLELIIDRLLMIMQYANMLMGDKEMNEEAGDAVMSSIGSVVSSFISLVHNVNKNEEKFTNKNRSGSTERSMKDVHPSKEYDLSKEVVQAPVSASRRILTNRLRDRNLIKNPRLDDTDPIITLTQQKHDRRKACSLCGIKPTRHVSKKLECKVCKKCFTLEKFLQRHLGEGDCKLLAKSDEADSAQTNLTQKKKGYKTDEFIEKVLPNKNGRYECSRCEKTFKTERILKKHMQIHTGKFTYKCPQCEKGYYNIGSYKAHLSTHTGEKYFTCKECGKGFPHSSSYNFHMRNYHTSEQKFKCDICNRKYKNEKYLKDHIQSVHLQPNKYKCIVCHKTFGHRASLFMHAKSHKNASDVNSNPSRSKREKAAKNDNKESLHIGTRNEQTVETVPPNNTHEQNSGFETLDVNQIHQTESSTYISSGPHHQENYIPNNVVFATATSVPNIISAFSQNASTYSSMPETKTNDQGVQLDPMISRLPPTVTHHSYGLQSFDSSHVNVYNSSWGFRDFNANANPTNINSSADMQNYATLNIMNVPKQVFNNADNMQQHEKQ